MGCKQTKSKSSSPVAIDISSPPVPIYVKSALKNSRSNGRGKSGRNFFTKKKPTVANKSVNFDEKVRVKLRTPTPNKTQYNKTFNEHENDEDDDQVSSVSSQDDVVNNQQIKSIVPSTNPSLQRNQPNNFWYKNNSIGITTSTNNNNKEKPQLLSPVPNTIPQSPENPHAPIANRFRVRRKVQYPVLPEPSSPASPVQSSSTPVIRTRVPASSVPIQRPLSNTNAILIEHHAPLPNGGISPQTSYYAFSRRSANNKTSSDK